MQMKALTVKQPWASAIVSGRKDIENRSWAPRSIVGQRILIHAGKTVDRHGLDQCGGVIGPLSAILGSVLVVDVVESSTSPWWNGPLGWVLDEPLEYREPIPCVGRLSLWAPAPDVVKAVLRAEAVRT